MELEQTLKHSHAWRQFDADGIDKSKPEIRWNILIVFKSFFKKHNR